MSETVNQIKEQFYILHSEDYKFKTTGNFNAGSKARDALQKIVELANTRIQEIEEEKKVRNQWQEDVDYILTYGKTKKEIEENKIH